MLVGTVDGVLDKTQDGRVERLVQIGDSLARDFDSLL